MSVSSGYIANASDFTALLNSINTSNFRVNLDYSSNTLSSSYEVAIGSNNTLSSSYEVAIGSNNTLSSSYGMAIGNNNTINGNYSLVVGYGNKLGEENNFSNYSYIIGNSSEIIMDEDSLANKFYSGSSIILGGYNHSISRACAAIIGGYNLIADAPNSVVIGHYNSELTDNTTYDEDTNLYYFSSTSDIFVIGNGYNYPSVVRSNSFRITYGGSVYGTGAFNTSGADYAEFIKPWYDNNENNEDRVGYFVTIKQGYLHKANEGDKVIGIISGAPCIVGNADENYYWKYERDEFNRIVRENGNYKLSDSYDSSLPYVERRDRPEWDYVGMIGTLPVRDDGTCEADGFCKCGKDGVGTKSEDSNDYLVIERISDNVVSVILK